jgi:hypothetical protein
MVRIGCFFEHQRLILKHLWIVNRSHNPKVLGSNPSPATKAFNHLQDLVTPGKSPLSPNRNRLLFTGASQWPHLRANPASLGRTPVLQPDCLRGV